MASTGSPASSSSVTHSAVKLEAEARRRQGRAVIELLAQGRTIAEVAAVLGITTSAVRRMRS